MYCSTNYHDAIYNTTIYFQHDRQKVKKIDSTLCLNHQLDALVKKEKFKKWKEK